MKFNNFCFFLSCIWIMPIFAMDEYSADEVEQDQRKHMIQRLGHKFCEKILAQWSPYEKRLLVTMFQQVEEWPTVRVAQSKQKETVVFFAHGKELYKDHFKITIDKKQVTVLMDDFKILAELHRVNGFESYDKEMSKFFKLRAHFATEDETWEQMNRQIMRAP